MQGKDKSLFWVVVIIILIIIGAFGVYYFMGEDTKVDMETSADDSSEMPTNQIVAGEPGRYQIYTEDKLVMAETGDVLLFFRADWCPTCRALDKDIREHSGEIPTDLTILGIDYDNSSDLKQKYGVTYQHTLVQVDSKGNLIKKWSGSPTLSALVSEIK